MSVLSRASLDSSLLFLAILTLVAAVQISRVVRVPHQPGNPGADDRLEVAGVAAGAFFVTGFTVFHFFDLVPILCLFLMIAAMTAHFADQLSARGIVWTAAQITTVAVSALWAGLFVMEAGLPIWLEVLALASIVLGVLSALPGMIAGFAREAVLTHEYWRRPVYAPVRPSSAFRPKVSLHLPCYAEPPEVVKETMNRLADLDYDNFEVLVCDNNTRDERLWRPLERHCATLNARLGREVFRFFHLASWPGAKAGALNFCLGKMAPDAELVGVVDADYLSRKDFLARLVPLFEDPAIGYLQTPHDYRAYGHSDFLAACYWEYMPSNKLDWPGISEYGGAFTIGTMCLMRTEALHRAGGWAEWCLTEDSEVSVRMRAAGYSGLYLGETFGRGLIPETFDDYRKQRFRWTAGPVQQLRQHWRLFLPAPFAPALPGWTKLLEVTRCAAPLARLAALVMTFVSLVAMMGASILRGDASDPIDVPNVSWLLLGLGAITWLVRTRQRYRMSGCDNVSDMIRGEIARASLSFVVLQAGIAGLSRQPLAWRRTPKFALQSVEKSPIAGTMAETIAGSACLLVALVALLGAHLWGQELALLAALGLMIMAAQFFCAPLMAAMAIRHAEQLATVEPEPRWSLDSASAIPSIGPVAIPQAGKLGG